MNLEEIEKLIEEKRELERIRCPYCKEVNYESGNPHDINLTFFVTYWGESGPQEFECIHCERTFMVEEEVTRNFDVTTIEDNPTTDVDRPSKIHGLELHFSAIKALIQAIESLLNRHPIHEHSAKKDFKHAYFSILMSMQGWITDQMQELDETVLEDGRLCAIKKDSSDKVKNGKSARVDYEW
jgi:DNA-directed RNA polymerase subunit RPC12/RpoP